MNKHRCVVRAERTLATERTQLTQWRVSCQKQGCQWTEKARTQAEASARGVRHEEFPHRP